MKNILCLLFTAMLGLFPSFSLAATDDIGQLLDKKMDQATHYLKKSQDTPKAWQVMMDISAIIQKHPNYDDGEYAEGMNDLVTVLLTKPWKYTQPYLVGEKSTKAFQDFIVDHVSDLSSASDLTIIKKIVSTHCDPSTYPVCKKLLTRIDQSMPH